MMYFEIVNMIHVIKLDITSIIETLRHDNDIRCLSN